MPPLVSVVMPCHNGARWLGRAIESVLAQTHANFELIIVDDGSTDASASIIANASVADPRLRTITLPENRGIVQALNTGLDATRGAFVARMDADDVCFPERLEYQVDFMERTGIDLCGTWFVEFGQGFPRAAHWPHSEAPLRAAMLFQNTICHPTVMARRDVFTRFRYREDYRLVEDYDLFARACGAFRMANLPRVLLRYRRHPAQATQMRRDAMESVNCRIRAEALARQGFTASNEELRLHNMVRAQASITSIEDLRGIEAWLLKLRDAHADASARRVVASQWTRACVRAAPLGRTMREAYMVSPLRAMAGEGARTSLDLRVLSALRLNYRSPVFSGLRRLGLSA